MYHVPLCSEKSCSVTTVYTHDRIKVVRIATILWQSSKQYSEIFLPTSWLSPYLQETCNSTDLREQLTLLLKNITAEISTVTVEGQLALDEGRTKAKESGVKNAEMTELSRVARNITAEWETWGLLSWEIVGNGSRKRMNSTKINGTYFTCQLYLLYQLQHCQAWCGLGGNMTHGSNI